MKNVWETCKFSDEIINGQLEIAKFAVELHSILDGTADKSYLDAETFLDNTYVTDAIEIVLTNSLLRLSKNQGKASDLLDVVLVGVKLTLLFYYIIFLKINNWEQNSSTKLVSQKNMGLKRYRM